MKKTEIIKQTEAYQKSLYAQFIVIYGIMLGIALVSFIAAFAAAYSSPSSPEAPFRQALTASQSILVNSFVPTTITLLATALFEYEFVRTSKITMAIYITLLEPSRKRHLGLN